MKSITKLIIAVPLLIFGIPALHILITTVIPKNPLVVMNGKEFLIPAELRDYVGYGGGDSILFYLDGKTLEVATKFDDSLEGRKKVIRVRARPFENESIPKNVQAAYKKMFHERKAKLCRSYEYDANKYQICAYDPIHKESTKTYLIVQDWNKSGINRTSCSDISIYKPVNPTCASRMVLSGNISVHLSFNTRYENKIPEIDYRVRQHFDRFHQAAQLLKQGNK